MKEEGVRLHAVVTSTEVFDRVGNGYGLGLRALVLSSAFVLGLALALARRGAHGGKGIGGKLRATRIRVQALFLQVDEFH